MGNGSVAYKYTRSYTKQQMHMKEKTCFGSTGNKISAEKPGTSEVLKNLAL